MRGSLLGIVLLTCSGSQAQSWCPPGAEWTFNYIDQLFGTGVHRIDHVGDTVIDGQAAQRLEHWVTYTNWGQPEPQTVQWGDLHTYEAEGVVFLKSDWISGFDTVMWFSAAPGDHWTVPGNDMWAFVVLDTSTITFEGIPLRQLIVQVEPEGWFPVDTLRERIGFQWFYMNPVESMVIDGNYEGLRCYQDNEIFHPMPGVVDCGYAMSTPSVDADPPPDLFPSPGDDHFMISLPHGRGSIAMIDATGRVVLQERITGDQARINTARLPSGVYRVRVDEGLPRLTWVKQ